MQKYTIFQAFLTQHCAKSIPENAFALGRCWLPYPPEPPADLRPWLAYKWRRFGDALTQREVATLLGYSMDAVRRWLGRGWLKSIKAGGKDYIPKPWLLDFAMDYGYRITKKSSTHKALLDAFFRRKD